MMHVSLWPLHSHWGVVKGVHKAYNGKGSYVPTPTLHSSCRKLYDDVMWEIQAMKAANRHE